MPFRPHQAFLKNKTIFQPCLEISRWPRAREGSLTLPNTGTKPKGSPNPTSTPTLLYPQSLLTLGDIKDLAPLKYSPESCKLPLLVFPWSALSKDPWPQLTTPVFHV